MANMLKEGGGRAGGGYGETVFSAFVCQEQLNGILVSDLHR